MEANCVVCVCVCVCVARASTTDRSNEIWSFGQPAYDAIVQTMRLRQRLRPYIRAQWKEAARSGTPPIRPLFWEFPDDERATDITDQMMSGASIVFCCVVRVDLVSIVLLRDGSAS